MMLLLLLFAGLGHLSAATKWDGLTPWFSGSCECFTQKKGMKIEKF